MSGTRSNGGSVGRRVAVIACALLIAVQVVRSAAVEALADAAPQSAARLWPDHPAVAIQSAMVTIAAAVGKHQPVPAAAVAAATNTAIGAPLAPEPFLVRGVQAQFDRRDDLARAAFKAAERRDPRAPSAHYFLADHELRRGSLASGLIEVAALARVAPNGVNAVAPSLAAFASQRGNWPALRTLFRRNPEIAAAALGAMSGNAANAEAIVAMSTSTDGAAAAPWLPGLTQSLIAAGDYRQARAIWAKGAGVAPAPNDTVFDQAFTHSSAPPPFNWALTTSAVGLAERQPGGRLHVIFYGQQDGPLARQLVLLGPGTYRARMRSSATPDQAASFIWTIGCARASESFSRVALASAVRSGWTFTVPGTCPAQWLELLGVSGDITRQADVTIEGFQVQKSGNGG